MATVGTEDSTLLFQFDLPVSRPVPAMYYEAPAPEAEQPQEDSESLPDCSAALAVLQDARIYSQFNNYLNERWSSQPQPQPQQRQRQLLLHRRLKLEELVDKFWLKDGEIDEALFEDSSDEEGL